MKQIRCRRDRFLLKRQIFKPRLCLAIALLTLLLLFTISPLKIVFDRAALITYLQAYPCCVVIAFLLTYIVLTILGIPGTILTVVGGAIFGLVWGTLWSVIGATLGALGAFWTSRYLLRDYLERSFRKHQALIKFNHAVKQKAIAFVLMVRFAPISPFNLVNFIFGLTPIHWLPYTIATFFGIIPGTLAYTWLGVSGIEAIEGGDRLPFFLALGLLMLLSAIPLCTKKLK